MDSAEFNRTALVVLGSILFAMLLVAFSNLVLAPGARPCRVSPCRPRRESKPRPPRRPPPRRFRCRNCSPRPTPRRASQDSKVCATCHSLEKGGAVKIGPPLWGVVGRPVASYPGFAYSDSLKSLGGDWTYEKLDHWIANPKAVASGTKMAFAGEKDSQKDADILAYLQKLSDNPVPFPK